MAYEFGVDDNWVDRGAPNAASLVAPVELHGEEDVAGLGASVRHSRIVWRALEVDVLQIHISNPMESRRDERPDHRD